MVSENERLDIGKAYYKDGFQDGCIDTKKEIAKVLISKKGMSVTEVCEITGLSVEELKAL